MVLTFKTSIWKQLNEQGIKAGVNSNEEYENFLNSAIKHCSPFLEQDLLEE